METYDAAHKALEITEMLENILAYSPMKDLIHAQQVSRHRRKTIASSPILRRHMFLEAGTVPIGTLYSNCLRKRNAVLQHRKHPHPYLKRYFAPGYQQLRDYQVMFNEDYKPHILHILSWPQGQWEKMFIWQPPPTKVKIGISCGCLAELLCKAEFVEEGGVRLGSVLAKVKKCLNWGRMIARDMECEQHGMVLGWVPMIVIEEVDETWSPVRS